MLSSRMKAPRGAGLAPAIDLAVPTLMLAVSVNCSRVRRACFRKCATSAAVPPNRCLRLDLTLTTDGVLLVEVADSGPGEIRTRDVLDLAPEPEGGRGLFLVAALADNWGVRERDPGKVLWCECE